MVEGGAAGVSCSQRLGLKVGERDRQTLSVSGLAVDCHTVRAASQDKGAGQESKWYIYMQVHEEREKSRQVVGALKVVTFYMGAGHSWLYNLWSPVQKENVGVFIQI